MSAEKSYEIRDPIHGFITVSEWERDIINHPVFQRLRRIRQLGLTDMVYPGATHTRFEHSLGVMHLADRAYEILTSKRRYVERLESEHHYKEAGIKRDRCLIRLAALLHDVGHGPFSHVAESLFQERPAKVGASGPTRRARYTHEHYSAAIIRRFFKDLIDENGCNKTNYCITADEVAGLLEGDLALKARLFWRGLLTSQMDVDRMDLSLIHI